MYKILIADDEEKIRQLVGKYSAHQGHQVFYAENGTQAVQGVLDCNPDIVILDVMMPLLDGFSALREIRKHSTVPVIMLSARGEEYDKVHGFQLGVDDYVVKPFSPKELMLRVDAVLKRVCRNSTSKTYTHSGLCVDFSAHRVSINQSEVELSPREYELLAYFIENPGVALTRQRIMEQVWKWEASGDDRTLDTHIKMLRKNLLEYSLLITTIRGVGYRFEG